MPNSRRFRYPGCFRRRRNSAATALFGFTEQEAIGQPIEIIIPQHYRDSHRQRMDRLSSGGPSHVIGKTVELAAIRKDGSEFPVELSLATWFLDDTRYYTGIIRDISERKQAEAKFRSVTESAIDAIISADHKGNIISWNRAATRILGYEERGGCRQAAGTHHPTAVSPGTPSGNGSFHQDGRSTRHRHDGGTVGLYEERP